MLHASYLVCHIPKSIVRCHIWCIAQRTSDTPQMIALALLSLVAAAAVNASLVVGVADRLTPKAPASALTLVASNENAILAAKLAA
jgi:hypothetical protein